VGRFAIGILTLIAELEPERGGRAEICTPRSTAELTAFVQFSLIRRRQPHRQSPPQQCDALEQANRALDEAEHELDLYISNPRLLTLLGENKFVEGAQARQAALDQARSDLVEPRGQTNLTTELADGELLKAWPDLTTQEKRRLLHGLLDRVNLSRRTAAGRHADPVGERTEIILRGGTALAVDSPASDEPRSQPTQRS
jgi:hypothetical protein